MADIPHRGVPEEDADALLAAARKGGPNAALAARRAAILTQRRQPDLAREALQLLTRLEPSDPEPKLVLARMHGENGDLTAAKTAAADVLQAVDQGARARAGYMLGEIARIESAFDEARRYYQAALKIENTLLDADRNNPILARRYARVRGRIAELDASAGDLTRARTGAEGALTMLRGTTLQISETPELAADIADAEMRLAALELDLDQANTARRRLSEAIGRYEALAVLEDHEPHWRAVLSDAWALAAEADFARNAPDKAREAMDKSLQARIRLAANFPEEAWALAGTWRLRAALRAALGDAEAVTESMAQARALAETLCARADGAPAAARFLVHTILDQADHALRAGDLNQAREAADSARVLAESFARLPEAAPDWLGDAAACWDRLGELARQAQAPGQMQEAFARAVEFRRMAYDSDPAAAKTTRGLAAALVRQGEAALDAGANETARQAFAESASLRLRLLDAAPDNPQVALALAVALERMGLAARASGDFATARGAWADELALADRIFADDDAIEALRFRAIVEAHLVDLGGADAEQFRQSSLARFDALAKAGVLTEREAALRRKLWGGGA